MGLMQEWAQTLCGLFAPYCERVEIAGSVRRLKPAPSDIELLAVPKIDSVAGGLFGDQFEDVNLLDAACDRWLTELTACGDGPPHPVLSKRLDKNGIGRWGSRYKAATFHSVPVDLFVCLPPAQPGLLLVIRTGPADYSKQLVTPRSQGGWLPNWLQVKDGALQRRDDGTILPTPDEADVYNVLGLAYVPPEQRGVRVPA